MPVTGVQTCALPISGINPKKNREKKKEKNKGNGGSSIDRIMGRLSKWFQEPDDNDE